MDDVFDVLTEDQEDVRKTLAELEKGPTMATGATEDQLMLRKMMTDELIAEEFRHEAAEQEHLWPAVRRHVTDGGPLADLAVCQQLEIGELLAELAQLEADEPEYETALDRLIRACREHMDFKERRIWPGLRAALTPKASAELGRKFVLGKQLSALLPHPRASASPGGTHYGSFG